MRQLILLPVLALLLTASSPSTGSLDLVVDNIKQEGGTIWVGIYESEEDFLDREKARLIYQKVKMTGSSTIRIDNLRTGRAYAIGIFHDENDNGELDKNFLGLPAEPWAFSQPLRSPFRLPRFEEMTFVYSPSRATRRLKLRKL